MSDLTRRIEELSPEKRELLQMLLHENDTASVWRQEDFVAPTTVLEEQIASLWSRVLGVERVGIHDNYFELGGDSIQAIQIIARSRQQGFRFTTAQLFDHPTIAELAAVVEIIPSDGEPVAAADPSSGANATMEEMRGFFVDPNALERCLGRGDIEDVYPLSPMQQGMLFQALAGKTKGIYLEQGVCTLQGVLDEAAFEMAWQDVLSRHPSLRTSFAWHGVKEPIQLVHKKVTLPISYVDWSKLTGNEQQDLIDSYLRSNRAEGIDLNNPPLMRLRIVRLGEEKHHVIWAIHHLIHDAWSTFMLLKEVFTAYEARRDGRSVQSKPARPYRDYVSWIRHQDINHAEQFWRNYLHGLRAPLVLPGTESGAAQEAEETYGQLDDRLDEDTSSSLDAMVRKHHVTLNAFVVACWSILLARYSQQRDVLFGTIVSGRPTCLDGVESIVGLFINTLPNRVLLDLDESFMELAKRLHVQQRTLQEHEFTPLRQIQHWSEVPQGTPLFETALVFQNAFEYVSGQIGSLRIDGIRSYGHSNLPLTLRVTPGKRLLIEILYDEGRYSKAKASEILNAVKSLLTQIATAPILQVASLISVAPVKAEPKSAAAGRFRSARPKPVKISLDSLVRTSSLTSASRQPLLVQPQTHALNLSEWARENLQWIEANLLEYGALLFRDFKLGIISSFDQFVQTLSADLLEYKERSTPRTELGNRIYTSTEYPAHQEIAFHNEFSYANTWPMKICFHCVTAAQSGGETPIADSRRVYDLLDAGIRKRFTEKQVMYVRNYGSGIDLSWQEVFQTSDRQEVEDYCRKAPMEWEWRGEDGLSTRQVRPAVATHPKTGAMVWFNQAHLFHLSNLDASVRESMLRTFGEKNLPRHAYYGDGTPIEVSALDEIRAAYEEAAIRFSWKEGDLLMLDNMLTAHGRGSFAGPRKIVVAMAESYSPGSPAFANAS